MSSKLDQLKAMTDVVADTDGTMERVRKLIGIDKKAGIGRGRILIEAATTWKGIRNFVADQMKLEQLISSR